MDGINDINLKEEIKDLISNALNIKRNKITDDMSFIKDLGMDSFKSVEFIYELELKYNIKIPNDDIKNVQTICDVTNYISRKLASKRKD